MRLPEGGMARAAGVLVPDLVGDERYIDTHNKSGFAPIHLATLSGDSETGLLFFDFCYHTILV